MIPNLGCHNLPKKDELIRLFNEAVTDGIRQRKEFVIKY